MEEVPEVTGPETTSERDIAAYALVLLLDHGIIPKTDANRAVRALALDRSTIQAALDEYNKRGHRPPALTKLWHAPLDSEYAPAPFSGERRTRAKSPGARAKQTHNMRDTPRGTERRCARCGGWFPATADYFGWKDQARGFLRSYCTTCWSERQAQTYLNQSRRQLLEGAGLTFVVPDDENVTGVRCSKCDRPILPGEDVTGHVDLTHVACGDSDAGPD